MTTTYVTFGTQYGLPGNRYGLDVHPSGYPVSGDGWCEITGCTADQARAIAHVLFDSRYAFTYPESEWNRDDETFFNYPCGCQLRVTVEAVEP